MKECKHDYRGGNIIQLKHSLGVQRVKPPATNRQHPRCADLQLRMLYYFPSAKTLSNTESVTHIYVLPVRPAAIPTQGFFTFFLSASSSAVNSAVLYCVMRCEVNFKNLSPLY